MRENDQSLVRILQVAAYIVLVAWGIRAASQVLVLLFMGITGAYGFLPLPNWLMKRFNVGKHAAMALMGT